jgi:hypothetical protein
MTLRKERSGSRFVARTDDDKAVIELQLFHDTVPALKPLSVGFELLVELRWHKLKHSWMR